MKPRLTDTSRTAEQLQIALLRQAGLIRRIDLAAEMTSFAIAGAYAALRRRYPAASDLELRLLFVEHHYGQRLAQQIRAALMLPEEGNDIVS